MWRRRLLAVRAGHSRGVEFVAQFAQAAFKAVDLAPLGHDHLVEIGDHPLLIGQAPFQLGQTDMGFVPGHWLPPPWPRPGPGGAKSREILMTPGFQSGKAKD
jgi:hypothetical protein